MRAMYMRAIIFGKDVIVFRQKIIPSKWLWSTLVYTNNNNNNNNYVSTKL